ncbi:hypothetical protein BDZ91DRAFT_747031 [Kalaharituber pfeilii]|nr:hypothetical protein BDZ91DRAFT_747031 [Kalaharituber pfeilii]
MLTDDMAQPPHSEEKRDPYLTRADEILTDDKLDNLWGWFRSASQNNIPSQMIFARLVNAARYPYYDNLLLARHTLSPGPTPYTPSECTVSAGPAESHQRPDSEEGHFVIKTLQAGLAIAEESLQTKQRIIKQLEDSLQMKQAMVDQLEGCMKQMENKQQEYKEKVEKLECDLASLRAEQGKSANIASKLVAVKWYNTNIVGISSDQAAIMTRNSGETFNILRHPNHLVSFQSTTFPNKYLSVDPSDVFTASSFGGKVKLCDSCCSKSMFRLHDAGVVYIEPLDFPGHFLNGSYDEGGIKTVNSKIPDALFHPIEK